MTGGYSLMTRRSLLASLYRVQCTSRRQFQPWWMQGCVADFAIYSADFFRILFSTQQTIKVTGNLNNVGTFVDGEFNTTTKTFTEAGAAESV